MLVPGLAVANDGMRLGRGGGSYDRALGRVPVGTFTCVLLYDGEVGIDVPREPPRPTGDRGRDPARDRPILGRALTGVSAVRWGS